MDLHSKPKERGFMPEEILPGTYLEMTDQQVVDRIKEHKAKMGGRLVILGHHYQRDEIIDLSDFRGDSFGLSRMGTEQEEAEFIVFCGVHFMAQSADILARPGQVVQHPDPRSGCPLADMADLVQVEGAWKEFHEIIGDEVIIPVTYMNSDATIKAFCGHHGGTVCTSSSAAAAFDWALSRGTRIMFFPDEHLGRNTANAKGIGPDEIIRWDPARELGGNPRDSIEKARVVLWNGFCHVHTFFTIDHVAEARRAHPGAKVVVHPECMQEVVNAADANGSTEFIINYCEEASKGSTIVVGTEINLVGRIAKEMEDVTIYELARSLCPNMYRIDTRKLLWTLDNLGSLHVMEIPEEVKQDARVALRRMLELG